MKNLIIIFVLCLGLSGQAQKKDRHEQIKALRVPFLTEELNLTPAEAEKFWPIYNAHEEKLRTLRKQERKEIFEIIKNPTKSISKAANLFKSDTRITKGEREVSKRRAEIFFKLKPGEFISFADGKDKKVKFYLPEIIRGLPEHSQMYSTEDLKANFERVYIETRAIFQE